MAIKRFCDSCGNLVTKDVCYEVSIYDETLEKSILDRDACEDCMKKIKKFIEEKK